MSCVFDGCKSKLDDLIPKEVRQMVNQYKSGMKNLISKQLNQYENEYTITQFLNSLGFPSSLEKDLLSSNISDSLWRDIAEVQRKGGQMYLNNMMVDLQKKNENIKNRIEQEYGSNWSRKQSSNEYYIHTLEDYKGRLNQAKQIDQNTFRNIQNNLKYFELLSLPREKLDQIIPHRIDNNSIKQSKEFDNLRKELDNLEVEKSKAMEIISRIFASLNDDNVVLQFIQAIQQKKTENNILEQNKGKYMVMFNELGKISNNIKIIKMNLKNKNEKFMKVKNKLFKSDPANEQFFRDLDNYVKLFKANETQLQQGLNFYIKFEEKLDELNGYK